MSKIKILNVFILQLFFIRLCYTLDDNNKKMYGFLYFVVPFTGWGSNYKTIGKLNCVMFKDMNWWY